jgi:hypothetical protein
VEPAYPKDYDCEDARPVGVDFRGGVAEGIEEVREVGKPGFVRISLQPAGLLEVTDDQRPEDIDYNGTILQSVSQMTP